MNFEERKKQFTDIRKAISLANKTEIMDEALIDKMILALGYYYAGLYKKDFFKNSDDILPPDIDFIETVKDKVNALNNEKQDSITK